MKRYATLLAVPLAAMALLAGCGGDDDSSSDSPNASDTATQTKKPASNSGDSQVVDLQAAPDGTLAYEEDTLEAKSGNLAVAFTNDAPIAHDVVFEKDGNEVARGNIITGESETVSFDAKPGEYTYFCSLPGHREAGMEGTLKVK
ncbi:MAG TPA: plastocyanin/azurin family copper-binding protein [Solirubrobacterales bacterium]|nr:plastocyanin/azurin family copper-binding protein [Solirubrobacterales bacterium]